MRELQEQIPVAAYMLTLNQQKSNLYAGGLGAQIGLLAANKKPAARVLPAKLASGRLSFKIRKP